MDFSLKGNRIIICGKTKSGKSELLKYFLLKEQNKFNRIYVISLTEIINKFYSEIIPKEHIFTEFNEDWLENLIKKLKEYKKNQQNKDYHVLLILDDCADAMHQSKAINKIFVMGRHLNLSICVLAQYLNMIPLCSRVNTSFIILGQQNSKSIDLIIDEYLVNLTRSEFLDVYNNCTKNYNFLVINCNSTKNNEINEIYGIVRKE